jgi:hypothetical protein
MFYQKGDLVHIPSDVVVYQNTFNNIRNLAPKSKTSFPTIAVYLKQINFHFSLVTTVSGAKQIVRTNNLSFFKEVRNAG